MSMTSAAKIADITVTGEMKDRKAAGFIRGTIMSGFRNHAGAISGKENRKGEEGTVTDERICCRK